MVSDEPGPLDMQGARLAVSVSLDPRLVARPALVELAARAAGAERPFTELVEIARDHRLDVDPRPARADDHASDPAAGMRHAGAAAPFGANAAFGRGIEPQSHALQEGAGGEELAAALA